MPYISAEQRAEPSSKPNPGVLNYRITQLVDEFIGDDLTYARVNAAIGVLECAKLELYRRVAAPYEDEKLAENGDVYRER